MKCPRDGKALVFVDDGTHLRDRCTACEGVLLDREEIIAALGKRSGREVALAKDRVATLPEGGLPCPRDGSPMRRLDHRGVELDLCPECGSLWLDAGEAAKARASKAGKGGGARKAALAGAAAVTAGGVASGLAQAAGEVVVEGAIDVAFEVAVEAIGSLVGGLLS